MDRVLLGYMIDKPLFLLSYIFSMIPIWFVILLPVYKDFNIIDAAILLVIVISSRVYIDAEVFDFNPFKILINTVIKMTVSMAIQISILFLSILMIIGIALEEDSFVLIILILITISLFALFITGRDTTIKRIWGVDVISSDNFGFVAGIIYQVIWVIIFFSNDLFLITSGVILALIVYHKKFLKRFQSVY